MRQRDRLHAIERVIGNIYRYIRENFDMDDQVQVEIESTDLTLGSVTSALVRVSDSDPFFILDRMENVIQSNRAVRIDSGDFKISDPLQTTERGRIQNTTPAHVGTFHHVNARRVEKDEGPPRYHSRPAPILRHRSLNPR